MPRAVSDKENLRPMPPPSSHPPGSAAGSDDREALRKTRNGYRLLGKRLKDCEKEIVHGATLSQAQTQGTPGRSRSVQTQRSSRRRVRSAEDDEVDEQDDDEGDQDTQAGEATQSNAGRILAESVAQANLLYQNVSRPQEATLDSRVLLSAANLARERARRIKRGKECFNLDEFFGRVAAFSSAGAEDDSVRRSGLSKLAKVCIRYSIRPPVSDFLLGPLQAERRERIVRATNVTNRRRARGELAKVQELTERETVGVASSNSTTKLTIVVAKVLREESPIDLFSFVCNPKSFSQTVENLFSLAFLVKEGRAGIYENPEGLQMVMSLSDNGGDAGAGTGDGVSGDAGNGPLTDGAGKWARQHGVITLDMETWRAACELLELEDALIPHRQEAERLVTNGRAWY